MPPPATDLHTVTSSTLLQGLRDPGNDARWQQYVDRYRPLIVSFAMRRGLSSDDAEEVAQNSLMEFSRAYRDGNYDRDKGRLRSWLFGIVHRQFLSFRRRSQQKRPASAQDGDLEQVGTEGELEAVWQKEWEQAVLNQCLGEIRRQVESQTFRAFEEFALKERPAAEVAEEFGITENAVFGAKRRILQRLREIRPLMEDIW